MPNKYPGYRSTFPSRGYLRNPIPSSPPINWSAELRNERYQFEEQLENDEDLFQEPAISSYSTTIPLPISTFIRLRKGQINQRESARMNLIEESGLEMDGEEDGVIPFSNHHPKSESQSIQHPRKMRSHRLFTTRMLNQPSLAPKLSRTTSIQPPGSGPLPPPPASLGRSMSAPSSNQKSTPPLATMKPKIKQMSLPVGVQDAGLTPSRCLSTTIVNIDSSVALEVAWRGGGFLRVLPIIGITSELSVELEDRLHLDVVSSLLDNIGEVGGLNEVGLTDLTSAVIACIPKLEDYLFQSLPSNMSSDRFESGLRSSWNSSLHHGLRVVTGAKTEALTPFDRWCEAEDQDRRAINIQSKHEGNRGGKYGKYRVSPGQSVFGVQECVVCGDIEYHPQLGSFGTSGGAAIEYHPQLGSFGTSGGADIEYHPQLGSFGTSGGAAMSTCGHWCCLECWQGYLESECGGGAARIGCPAFQCRASHLSRAALAHLVPPGSHGAAIFTRLEAFRAEKTKFFRRFQEDAEASALEDDTVRNMRRNVARYCPDPRCNRLLRTTSDTSDPALLLCVCGGVVCGACGAEDGHLGLSCQEKAFHKKLCAELDREAESLQWLEQNTKSCPKCAYPIEKNGGCLHMRCQRCQHYFCWECLGVGEKCYSFRCNSSRTTRRQTVVNQNASRPALAAHREASASLKQRHDLLHKPDRLQGDDGKEPMMAVKAQLLHMKYFISLRMWMDIQGKTNSAMSSSSFSLSSSISSKFSQALKSSSQSLDLLLHVLSERQVKEKKRVLTTRALQAAEEKKQRKFKALIQKNQDTNDEGVNEYQSMLADSELTELLSMSQKQLRYHAAMAMRAAVRALLNISSYDRSSATTNKVKPSNRGSTRPAEDLVRRSVRLSGRNLKGGAARKGNKAGIPPWQDRHGLNPSKYSGEMGEGGLGKKDEMIRVPWKGREKAKAHTQRSWKADDWEMGIQ